MSNLTNVTESIKTVINAVGETRNCYNEILNTIKDDPELTTSKIEAIVGPSVRVFQILVIADMIAMQALRSGADPEFMQHLADSFEVYELAYRKGLEARAELEAAREQEALDKAIDDVEWPDPDEEIIH